MRFPFTGGNGSLFTRPDQRRKSLASLVVQEISENFFCEVDIPSAGGCKDSISSDFHLNHIEKQQQSLTSDDIALLYSIIILFERTEPIHKPS